MKVKTEDIVDAKENWALDSVNKCLMQENWEEEKVEVRNSAGFINECNHKTKHLLSS